MQLLEQRELLCMLMLIISRGYDKELYDKIENEKKPKLLLKNKINIV